MLQPRAKPELFEWQAAECGIPETSSIAGYTLCSHGVRCAVLEFAGTLLILLAFCNSAWAFVSENGI